MSQEAQPQAPQKSRRPLFVGAILIVLLTTGGGAYWKFAAPAGEAPAPVVPPAHITLDPFVVNLTDPGSRRFLRLTVGIVVEGEEQAAEFSEDAVTRMRVRSAILERLAQQSSEELVTPAGKDALKALIAEILARDAHHLKVSDVLFSEFIVQ